VPALLAFYRAAANFNGSDALELEITVQGGASSSSTPRQCRGRQSGGQGI
jgi:hypothetical protein